MSSMSLSTCHHYCRNQRNCSCRLGRTTSMDPSTLTGLDALILDYLQNFESQISHTGKTSKIQELMCRDSPKFNKKSCGDQHKCNQPIMSKLEAAKQNITLNPTVLKENIGKGIGILTHRTKIVKFADTSEAGWKTVKEYIHNPIALESGDEKKWTGP